MFRIFLALALLFTLLAEDSHARPIRRRFAAQMSGGGSSGGGLTVWSTPYWTDGQSVGNLTSTADWVEISGITQPTLSTNQNYIWMQSDGSIDKIFAVNKATAASAGELTVGTKNGIDYEDLSSARISGQSYIYLADIGNNGGGADSRGVGVDGIIYRIKEPVITGGNFTISDGDIETIQVVFPGGGGAPSHRDAECLMVDPDTGKMYIITKREAVAGVYSLTHAASLGVGIQTLVDEGNMFDIPDVSSSSASGNVVGCNISPNGQEILIKSYDVMYHFPRNKSTQTVIQALQATPLTVDGYVGGGNSTIAKSHPSQEPQGEAVTFDYDGGNYYTASEFVAAHGSTATRYPFFKYTRLNTIPTTISFQEGVAGMPNVGYTGSSDTYIWDTNPSTDNGAATSTIEDKAAGVETDQRKGLHKWDITLVPYGATIVGARADMFIAAEGQGIAWYRILTADWVESSTYNSLTGGVNDDGVEASTVEDNRNAVNLDTILNLNLRNNLRLDTPQAWVSGTQNNYGYLIEGTDTAGDGMQLASREAVTASQRPKLTLRYTGGYTPESEPSLVRWYSGHYEPAETWLADGAAISSLPDRSVSNQDASQATAGNRPTIQTRESNLRPVVRFDASDDFLSIPAITLTADWTIFIVMKSSNVTGTYHPLVDLDGDLDGLIIMDVDAGTVGIVNNTSDVRFGGDFLPSIYQIHAIKSDTKWYISGTQQDVVSGAVVENPTMVFNQIGNDGNPINGDIAEILIFNADLDTAGMNRVGNYLKWAHKLAWTNLTDD